jgi:hypothetical protein
MGMTACDRQNVPNTDTFVIEGEIVSFVSPCQGFGLLISVDNIQNFGETGSYPYNASDSLINYTNAILVPFFNDSIEGINLITSSVLEGDKLKFECRKAVTEEDFSLFFNNYVCLAIYGPIPVPRYVITKIINYQKQ